MKDITLLVSPQTKNAWFAEYIDVAKAELNSLLPNASIQHSTVGAMNFLTPDQADIDDALLESISRLSFVQGIFEQQDGSLAPLDHAPTFNLHEDFVFGAKYKGKTNEMLTQLLINLGLHHLDESLLNEHPKKPIKLLDPMCGRATTLLWAMRYGLQAKGLEQDGKALAEIQQTLKKWCKIHRQKHKIQQGHVSKSGKNQQQGKFLEFLAADTNMRVIHGDACNATELLNDEKFHLLVSDLPYGIQHFTTQKTRNPTAVLEEAAPGWANSLKPGGVMVLAYNRYLPKRQVMIDLFEAQGLTHVAFDAAHRMSESIVRDIVIFKR